MYNNSSDTTIINSENLYWKSLIKGDIDALGQLYKLYVEDLYSYGYKYVSDKSVLMDCIHDLFLELYKYKKKLSPEVNVRWYLYKSFRRILFKKFDHRLIVTSDISNFIDGRSTVELNIESIEDEIINSENLEYTLSKLKNILGKLSQKQRMAVLLRFQDGKSYEEISDIMSISISSARTAIYRSLKVVKEIS